MAKEAIERVKRAEDEAQTIIENARIKRDEDIKEANRKAQELYNKILKEAHEEADKIIRAKTREAENEAENIINLAKEKVELLSKIDTGKAINSIIERIVESNGYS